MHGVGYMRGQVCVAPLITLFNTALVSQTVMPHASKSVAAIVTKIMIDQLVWSPICTAIFYIFKCITEGRAR